MSDLLFADELPEPEPTSTRPPWTVLIVDDDPTVHQVTELALVGFEFAGRGLNFVNAYGGAEARTLLAQRDDIALVLLDVVMETEHAGLDLARYIREELRNQRMRIVLRTGQPGQAPEEQVIKNYDINDYKEKTELTKRKLTTVFYAALRAYRDLMIIEQSRQALRRSIDAITRVYDSHNLRQFASSVLEQVAHLLGYEAHGLCASRVSAYAASHAQGRLKVLAATTQYQGLLDDSEVQELPPKVHAALQRALDQCTGFFEDLRYVGYYRTSAGNESLLYMEFTDLIDAEVRELLEIFCANVAITYESLLMREEIEETQRSTVYIVGEAVQHRAKESGFHVQRVSEIAALLGQALGLPDAEVEQLRQAAPLHDVGKVGVSDSILDKPAVLDAQERQHMQLHAQIGYELLRHSGRSLLQLAATIAHEHHERWDGQGYPRGLAGEQIHVAGRIVALADAFDALMGHRPWRSAWALPQVLEHVRTQAGQQFDPQLCELLLQSQPQLEALYQRWPDPQPRLH
ncbi:DUF3369 domain-containing protein [Roseateles sp. BYS180W]|uniref:DUF3369 domain-containing protein n=1 Tax=Roseateles rivi TaxID=3299028 RepID=A0ABW7FX88_9BURK